MRRGAVLVVLLLCACGGSDDESTVDTPTTVTSTTTTPAVEVDLVVTGEPTAFEPGDGRAIDVDVAGDGTCASDQTTLDDSDPFFALCQAFEGEGGTFVVLTVSRDTDDHDTGVLCADGDGFVLWAVSLGSGTPVTTTLDLPDVGEFALVAQHAGFVTEATEADGVVVAQPAGADCPVLHGLGPVAPGAGTVGAFDAVVQVAGDDEQLCVSFLGGAFDVMTGPAESPRCPEPGG
jgi:hypothetical protein